MPAENRVRPGEVRVTLAGIVHVRFDVDDGAARSGKPNDGLGELEDRALLVGADVHRLGVVAQREAVDAFHDVGAVAERAGLTAVAVDGERLAQKRLLHELGHDAPVVEAHPGAVGVEEPNDARLHPVEAAVRHRHRLGEPLGLVVHRAGADRVDVAPVGLRLGVDGGIAIDLARRGHEEPCALLAGEFEGVLRSDRADAHHLQRKADEIERTGGTGEVEHEVHPAFDPKRGADVRLLEVEAVVPGEVCDVPLATGDQVVDRQDLPPFSEKKVRQVGA